MNEDAKNFKSLIDQTNKYVIDLLNRSATTRAVASPLVSSFKLEKMSLPLQGLGTGNTLKLFESRWSDGMSNSISGRYLGFVVGGVTPAALIGDWVTSTIDQNPISNLDSIAPQLERETLSWFRQLFNLTEEFEGSFVSGATSSNMVGLAIGREWVGLVNDSIQISQVGIKTPISVLSCTPHSSIYKALSQLGMGRSCLIKIPSINNRESIDLIALETALKQLNQKACIVVCNLGAVNTGDFDDLENMVKLKNKYKFYLHVDAAFGAFAGLVPSLSHLLNGIDQADSICIDCHKWLNVPYDSAVQFTKFRNLQVNVFQNSAEYLGSVSTFSTLSEIDFVHLTPENSRRFRALSSWFSLTAYGKQGHSEIVQNCIYCARKLGEYIKADPRLHLLAPVQLNIVCFTVKENKVTKAQIEEILINISKSGETFLTITHVFNTWAMRAAFSNWKTTEQDVERIFTAIQTSITSLYTPQSNL